MIGHSDIKLGKISTFPSTFLLPLLGTHISHSKHTQERHQKVLIQWVPNKPNIPVPHQTQEPGRVNPGQSAWFGYPFPRIDETHVLSLALETVPCVSVKRACVVVERLTGRVEDPFTFEEVTRWWGWWGLGVREEIEVEGEEEESDEDETWEEVGDELRRHRWSSSMAPKKQSLWIENDDWAWLDLDSGL